MLRLPSFSYLQPASLTEALRMKADAGPDGMYVAGGTDLYPNMKRRHQEPKVVISLMAVPELKADGIVLGAGILLSDLSAHPTIRQSAPAVGVAAALVSTPLLRNMGTLGGNLCLDTRCNYYNQSYEWRKAIDFCMKKDGAICWVAPSSPRCWAVSSSDVAPVMVAIGAEYVLAGPAGERVGPPGPRARPPDPPARARRGGQLSTGRPRSRCRPAGHRSRRWRDRGRRGRRVPPLEADGQHRFRSVVAQADD